MINHKKSSGFIALISAIIISVVLLLVVVNISLTGFYNRYNILDSELKKRSDALAEACADTAIIKLSNDLNYNLVSIDHAIPIGTNKCDIYSINPNPPRSGNITIVTKANYNNTYYSTFQIILNSTNMSVVSWQEQ